MKKMLQYKRQILTKVTSRQILTLFHTDGINKKGGGYFMKNKIKNNKHIKKEIHVHAHIGISLLLPSLQVGKS